MTGMEPETEEEAVLLGVEMWAVDSGAGKGLLGPGPGLPAARPEVPGCDSSPGFAAAAADGAEGGGCGPPLFTMTPTLMLDMKLSLLSWSPSVSTPESGLPLGAPASAAAAACCPSIRSPRIALRGRARIGLVFQTEQSAGQLELATHFQKSLGGSVVVVFNVLLGEILGESSKCLKGPFDF